MSIYESLPTQLGHSTSRDKMLAAVQLWAAVMLRVRQAKTAHAKMQGSTCLMIQRMNIYTAFGVSTGLPRKHTMQNLVLSCIHCASTALQDSSRKAYCVDNVLPIQCLQLSESNGRHVAVHCIQQPLMQHFKKPHTVLLKSCGYTQHLGRLQSDNMLCQPCHRPNTVLLEAITTSSMTKALGEVEH